MDIIANRLLEISNAIENIDISNLYKAAVKIGATANKGGTIYVCGNGGSAATASHFKNDLEKYGCANAEFTKIKVICLNDNVPIMTAVANDISYDDIFKFQVYNKLRPEDLLIAISTSGSSPNILRIVNYARDKHISVIGMTGGKGGQLKNLSDLSLHTNIDGAANIEDIHSIMCHTIAESLNKILKH